MVLFGGFAGSRGTGTVENCYNTGNIIVGANAERVGGICGNMLANVKNCYNLGKIEGGNVFIGGIAGYLSGDMTNCYNKGEINSTATSIGGMAGVICESNIENCYNLGKINGKKEVGGIVGSVRYSDDEIQESKINNCYNEGKIIGTENNVGGIIGDINSASGAGQIIGETTNNYNKGEITGKSAVGGIIGETSNSVFGIKNCYNKGKVVGDEKIGAVIGEQVNSNENVTNLFYLKSIGIGAINGEDNASKNITGVDDNIDTYQDFLKWIVDI